MIEKSNKRILERVDVIMKKPFGTTLEEVSIKRLKREALEQGLTASTILEFLINEYFDNDKISEYLRKRLTKRKESTNERAD
jgi:hypothetical protein